MEITGACVTPHHTLRTHHLNRWRNTAPLLAGRPRNVNTHDTTDAQFTKRVREKIKLYIYKKKTCNAPNQNSQLNSIVLLLSVSSAAADDDDDDDVCCAAD